ncbi:outer membrane usher protein [Paraburkholderia sp. CI3]
MLRQPRKAVYSVNSRGASTGVRSIRPFQVSIVVTALGFAIPACQALAAPIPTVVEASASGAPAYTFDSDLLMGSSLGVADIERFNKVSSVDPGNYRVDIYVNDVFISRQPVEFRSIDSGEVFPCLSDDFLTSTGILVESGTSSEVSGASSASMDSVPDEAMPTVHTPPADALTALCGPLAQRVPGASTAFDLPRLRLNISVPHAQMKHVPRGAVDLASLEAGQTMAYFNYDTNYYTSSAFGYKTNSLYAGINAGLNIGLWRFHQQSAYTFNNSPAGSAGQWNNIRTYAERPLPGWNSHLTVGQNFTGGNLLSSVGYTGLHIETDERMLPDSMRGYAPVVNGVANTNARVEVSQNGNVIYQTTVAPGPFSINDLNPTSYQGDLTVRVFEANGQVSTFTVPFSAVPNSLRPGASHYSFTLGQVRQVESSNAKFADFTYERGLTNMITANGGARLSTDYQSILAGVVFGTSFGAFGLNAAWSNALDAQGNRVNGWRSSINYSHTLQQTMTTFSLAGYRYSTKGYRDFLDALSARAAYKNGETWSSGTYQQRDQFTVNVNQSLNQYGSLSLSAAVSSYYGSRPRDTQLQLSYNNHYKSINYNLSFIRQQTGMLYSTGLPNLVSGSAQSGSSGQSSNTFMATVSIPLGSGPRSASLSGSVATGTGQGTSFQTSVSGIADTAQTLSYGLSASAETQNGAKSVSGNVQKNLSMVTMGANYSQGNGFWQAGASARGAAVAHGGGVTFGPYLSNTFGLVEAKGAEGATVRNGSGARVDSSGYAIVPSLTPYRFNDVALDTKGINQNAELTGNQIRVAPYAGSAVLLKFSTLTGNALLIGATLPEGEPLPLGADVLDSTGAAIGMVGQGGQVYARVPEDRGTLTVKWGERSEDQCAIAYDTTGQDSAPIIRMSAKCTPPGSTEIQAAAR